MAIHVAAERQVGVDAKKYLLGLWPLWVVVFTHLFGECRWGCLFSHIVRLLFIQQPGNTHGIYRFAVHLC